MRFVKTAENLFGLPQGFTRVETIESTGTQYIDTDVDAKTGLTIEAKIKYVSQVPNTQIPTFVFYANLPQYVKEPYKRFLENKLRDNWTLTGTPINVFVRQK